MKPEYLFAKIPSTKSQTTNPPALTSLLL